MCVPGVAVVLRLDQDVVIHEGKLLERSHIEHCSIETMFSFKDLNMRILRTMRAHGTKVDIKDRP